MKQILLVMAVVMGQSVLAADEVVIKDPIIRDAVVKVLKKPSGKFVPPPKFTKEELEKVTVLRLSRTKITDVGLKEVAKLQKLKTLILVYTQITDAGLKEVAKLKQLTTLELRATKITDAGLFDVAKLQQLTSLELRATKITDEGAAELRKALPKCDISSEFD